MNDLEIWNAKRTFYLAKFMYILSTCPKDIQCGHFYISDLIINFSKDLISLVCLDIIAV